MGGSKVFLFLMVISQLQHCMRESLISSLLVFVMSVSQTKMVTAACLTVKADERSDKVSA